MAVASSQDDGAQDASSSYDLKMQQMRPAEFSRFEGSVYVDHAGAALYSEAQLEDVMQASPQPRRLALCWSRRHTSPFLRLAEVLDRSLELL